MPSSDKQIVFTDVLDPLTDTRRDVGFTIEDAFPSPGITRIDGAGLWVLPGLFDGDSHGPIVTQGRRLMDRVDALRGGVTQVGMAIPWGQIKDIDPAEITSWAATLRFPRIVPVLSLESPDESGEFISWLGKHGDHVRENWAALCKINLPDEPYPSYGRNLQAIWDAGLRAAIYAYNDELLAEVAAMTGGPIHHRHASTVERAKLMNSTPGSTSQVSPHYLLELAVADPGRLRVLPPVRDLATRGDLVPLLGSEIDMIATDHNSPVRGATGPGLPSTEYFLSALLTLADSAAPISLSMLLELTTSAPARVLQTDCPADSFVVLDPTSPGPLTLERGKPVERAPYLGLELRGTVLAVVDEGRGIVL